MEEHLWKVVESWNYWGKPYPQSIPREIVKGIRPWLTGKEAVYLYGPRRSGKTTVAYQLMAKSKKQECLYLNFEEPQFAGCLTPEFIEEVVQERKKREKQPALIVLDEVQNVPGWEKWVRTAVDKGRFKVIVTGSSAKLLSTEFASSLGGRGIGFLILPFSYKEARVLTKNLDVRDYFLWGGYPAVIQEPVEKRQRLLEEYFETAIARDIAVRYNVRDVVSLRSIAIYILSNPGKLVSYNSLRSLTKLSFDAIREYLGYLEDAFLVFSVPCFSYSLKQGLQKPRKYFVYDLGMQSVISKSFSPDWGRKAENAVGIELVRAGLEPQYFRNGFEIDFVVRKGMKVSAVNVCFTDTVPPREMKALEAFGVKYNAETRLLQRKDVKSVLLGNHLL